MKKLAWAIGVVGLLGSLGYLFSYVLRWQWNRALFAGIAVIALMIGLGIAMVMRKLGQLQQQLDRRAGGPEAAPRRDVLQDLADTRPARDHFAWLSQTPSQTNVFITVLLGGGIVVSGIAWLIGKVAEGTTVPAAEHRLAGRLEPLAFPDGGLTPSTEPTDDPAASLLRRPGGASRAG